jgi:ABC-type transporter Mla MlaB component
MKQRKAPRQTGTTRRVAKATAPKRKTSTPKAAKPKASKPVALPAECVIASAADLRNALLSRVTDAGNVQLDASAVQRVDTASLQVLAAFVRDRRADGLPLEWLGVPACLTDAANLLDLTNVLGLGSPGVPVPA